MGRECSSCQEYLSCSSFSRTQWLKGDGYSRCRDCVDGNNYDYGARYNTFQCGTCYRDFNNQNELNMHMQTHRPRNVTCPVCHQQRFRSGANAVQHVESGYCPGCPGADNARKQIYRFAQSHGRALAPYLTGTPQLEYGGGQYSNAVPDFPYQCPSCVKSFRQLSQLLQHQDQKHGYSNLLQY